MNRMLLPQLYPPHVYFAVLYQENERFNSVQVFACQYRTSRFLRTASVLISRSVLSSHHSPFCSGGLNLVTQQC